MYLKRLEASSSKKRRRSRKEPKKIDVFVVVVAAAAAGGRGVSKHTLPETRVPPIRVYVYT